MNPDQAEQVLAAELDMIQEQAAAQLIENYETKGDAWLESEPRWHMWKGIDELFSATHHAKRGEIEDFERCMADGLNHILMASHLQHSSDYM